MNNPKKERKVSNNGGEHVTARRRKGGEVGCEDLVSDQAPEWEQAGECWG